MQELCVESSQYYVEANRQTMVHALRWKTQNTIDLKIISKKNNFKAKANITMQGSLLQYLHLTTQEYSLQFFSTKIISRAQYEGKNKPEDDLQVEPFS
jgi:hypothetical protein